MDNVLTFSEVKEQVTQYAGDPSAEKLQDILMLTTQLSPVERAEVIKSLSDYNRKHGMSKSELQAEVNRLLKSADALETPFLKRVNSSRFVCVMRFNVTMII